MPCWPRSAPPPRPARRPRAPPHGAGRPGRGPAGPQDLSPSGRSRACPPRRPDGRGGRLGWGGWSPPRRCPGCLVRSRGPRPDSPGGAPSRARARAPRRRRPAVSRLLRVAERVAGPLRGTPGRVGHLGRELARLAGVVGARGGEIVLERPLGRLGAAPGILAPEDPVVLPACHPALQLGRADGV